MHNFLEVDAWVEEFAHIPYERFYPSAVYRRVNLPMEVVFGRLLELAKDGKLQVIFEIRCPECDRRLADYFDRKDIPDAYVCDNCGIDFSVDEHVVNPAFRFSKSYSELKRSLKNSRQARPPGTGSTIAGQPMPLSSLLPPSLARDFLRGMNITAEQVQFVVLYGGEAHITNHLAGVRTLDPQLADAMEKARQHHELRELIDDLARELAKVRSREDQPSKPTIVERLRTLSEIIQTAEDLRSLGGAIISGIVRLMAVYGHDISDLIQSLV